MDFEFNEEQEMLKKMARDFLTNKCPKKYVTRMETDDTGHDPTTWKEMAELGWQGLVLPEEYYGSSMQFVDLMVLMEEMGRACLPGPFFPTVILGALTILDHGNAAQKSKYLPGTATGGTVITMAVNEKDPRFIPDSIQMTADVNSDGYTLNGTKLFVPYAHIAEVIIVVARTEDKGITAFVVDPNTEGITCNELKSIGRDRLCELIFENVHISTDAVLGKEGNGWEIVMNALERAAVAKCCDTTGVLQSVFEMTVQYAKDRKQFDKPIGNFQIIQHYLAEMNADLNGLRYASYQAAWKISNGKPSLTESAIAKAWMGDAYERIITKAHQIHGAIGVTIDHDLHFYTWRGKAAQLSYGDSDFWRETVAQSIGM